MRRKVKMQLATVNGTTGESWATLPWLLTRKEVLAITGLKECDIRKLLASGELHRCKTGRKGRYFKSELARLLRIE